MQAIAAAKRTAARAAKVAIEAAAQAAEKADEAARVSHALRIQSGRTNTRRMLKRRGPHVVPLTDPPVSKGNAAAAV